MLKKVKIKNSTVILTGVVLVIIGFFFGFFEYLKEKKEKTFSDMNILLYESETPEEIKSEDKEEQKTENSDQKEEKKEEKKEEPKPVESSSSQGYRYNYIGYIEIPKIGVKRGFLDLSSIYNNVDYNVTVIQGSDYPDVANGNLILAAHSGNCSYCYFDNLYKLSKGDSAYITYGGIKYSYKILDIY